MSTLLLLLLYCTYRVIILLDLYYHYHCTLSVYTITQQQVSVGKAAFPQLRRRYTYRVTQSPNASYNS